MDVHKDSIDIALADPPREAEVRHLCGGSGQQECPHPVGGDDARRGVRCQPLECQAGERLNTAPVTENDCATN